MISPIGILYCQFRCAMNRNASLEVMNPMHSALRAYMCLEAMPHASNVPSPVCSWVFLPLHNIYGGCARVQILHVKLSPPSFLLPGFSLARKLGSFPSRSWAIPSGLLLLPLKMISDEQKRPACVWESHSVDFSALDRILHVVLAQG